MAAETRFRYCTALLQTAVPNMAYDYRQALCNHKAQGFPDAGGVSSDFSIKMSL
jgi:hypothetical protein